MIYLLYVTVAAAIVFLSNKASEYVDLLDKTTSLSGAFIGGILLSAVTSLPELFTSLSSTLILDKPGLCIGNILGSNLFNLAVISVCIIAAFRHFDNSRISSAHNSSTLTLCLMYGALLLNKFNILNINILSINITSIIIILLYIYTVKKMSSENGSSESNSDNDAVVTTLTLKQIIIRFIFVSIGIIVLSIAITYITDIIAGKLNLGSGVAGALFLGIATSLPEVSSTIALFKIKNYDIAVGNIIGSNVFNFLIFAIVDILYIGHGVYAFGDPQTTNLLLFSTVATPLMLCVFNVKRRISKILCPLSVACCYIAFLMV